MAFTRTWDAAYEALPTDANYGYEIDDFIRQTRVDVSERMAIDHVWKTGATDGMHKLSGFQGAQYAADAGSSDTYAITLSPVPAAYFTGMVVVFKANTVNTGTATLNVNSLGAKTIKKRYNEDLENGDILAGQNVVVVYDGTNFQLINEVSASKVKLGITTHDTSTASGTLAITGIGFKPSNVILMAVCNTVELSIGMDDGTTTGCIYHATTTNTWVLTSAYSITLSQTDGSIHSIAKIDSLDADGFTLAFTKLGAKTGTANIAYMAFR